jgi:hypothetical protein
MSYPKPGRYALLITGAVTAGKTSLVHKVDDLLVNKFQSSIKFINEQSTGPYPQIVMAIDPFKFPVVAFEHCWIHNKWYLIEGIYTEWDIIMVKLAKDLLEKNYQERLKMNLGGDFRNMNPHEQQETILEQLERIPQEFAKNIHIFDINSYEDYNKPAELAFNLISKHFAKRFAKEVP